MNKNILIVEDEEDIREILSYYLKKEGYSVIEASCGRDGIEIALKKNIDLIILDLMMDDISGYDVCREVLKKKMLPIIMLTARNDVFDKVLGLELGADDYITKPFDIREVIARIKVSLRRINSIKNKEIENKVIELDNDLRIHEESREVYRDEELIKLKPKEFDLLLTLAKNRKIVMSREKLLDKVWGYDFEGDTRTVDVHVQRIRKKLEKDNGQAIIETVFKVGYKML